MGEAATVGAVETWAVDLVVEAAGTVRPAGVVAMARRVGVVDVAADVSEDEEVEADASADGSFIVRFNFKTVLSCC